MSNRLQFESSPYLLQHAENPVDWYPWGAEAFETAAREDKPIFLSIGYSTCHWCHVMAHESFEDEEIAGILNAHFISIKVDREERPDIDSVYMEVCQAFTGSGGWPMSIFMTPQQKPFFAGTYFPAHSRPRMIGFCELLHAIAEEWEEHRVRLLRNTELFLRRLKEREEDSADSADFTLPEKAAALFSHSFDEKHGGFGGAPKFPAPHNLLFLLFYSQTKGDERALQMVKTTLTKMRKGGIFDHIGYGFSRYSTDRAFLAPHFEKMLYDNALLILAYTAAYCVTNELLFLDTAEKTASYVLREMTSPDGGFYSAQDADSGGVEGAYYLFGYDEILTLLGRETGERFCEYYGVTKKGNFEGQNICNRLHADEVGGEFDDVLPVLYEYRKKRRRLHLDDKILTSWNALMISALCLLFRVTKKSEYLTAAMDAQRYIEKNLSNGSGLFVSFRGGKCGESGFLDDYAFYAAALLSLYEATSEKRWLHDALRYCAEAENQFLDKKRGGYFLSGKHNEALILSPKETYDGAVPSGNAVMGYVLTRLSQITGEAQWTQKAERQLAFLCAGAQDYPAGHSMAMLSLLLYLNPPPKITVVLGGEKHTKPSQTLPLYADITVLPSPTKEYRLLDGMTTYYVCQGQTCLPPSNSL